MKKIAIFLWIALAIPLFASQPGGNLPAEIRQFYTDYNFVAFNTEKHIKMPFGRFPLPVTPDVRNRLSSMSERIMRRDSGIHAKGFKPKINIKGIAKIQNIVQKEKGTMDIDLIIYEISEKSEFLPLKDQTSDMYKPDGKQVIPEEVQIKSSHFETHRWILVQGNWFKTEDNRVLTVN